MIKSKLIFVKQESNIDHQRSSNASKYKNNKIMKARIMSRERKKTSKDNKRVKTKHEKKYERTDKEKNMK
jgi:hypothetical protein